jgi:hypothetical protein
MSLRSLLAPQWALKNKWPDLNCVSNSLANAIKCALPYGETFAELARQYTTARMMFIIVTQNKTAGGWAILLIL